MDFQSKVRETMNGILEKDYKEDIAQLKERAEVQNLETRLNDKVKGVVEKPEEDLQK